MKHTCKIKKDAIFERLLKLKREIKRTHITNNINNGTINNGTINNIVLIGYGKEDLAKMDRHDILKSLKKGIYRPCN